MLEMLLKLTKNNSNFAKINETIPAKKLLSPGMYKQSLTRNLNEKLRRYKSSHFSREISKLIKNCNL